MDDKIKEAATKIYNLTNDKVNKTDDNENRRELKKHMREIDKQHGTLLG